MSRLTYAVSFVFIVIACCLLFIFTTTPGLYLALKTANRILPGKLHFSGLQGQLINTVIIDNLSYNDSAIQFSAKKIIIDWQLNKLLLGKPFVINSFYINTVQVTVHDTPTTPQKNTDDFALPQLPLTISIKKAVVHSISVKMNRTNYYLDNVYLSAKLEKKSWQIESLQATLYKQKLFLTAQLQPQFPYALSSHLLTKPVGSEGIAQGSLIIEGDFTKYQWHATLSQPSPLRVDGTLEYGKKIATVVHWDNAFWPHQGTPQFETGAGKISIDGTLPKARITVESTVALPTPGTLKAAGHIDGDNFDSYLNFDGEQMQVDMSFDHDANGVTPKINGHLKAVTRADTLFFQRLKNASVTADVHGDSWDKLTIFSTIEALYLNNTLHASLQLKDEVLTSVVNLGSNTLTIKHQAPEPWHLDLNVSNPSLLDERLHNLHTSFSANADYSDSQHARFDVVIKQGVWQSPELARFPFKGGVIKAQLNPEKLQLDAQLEMDEQKKISVQASLPHINLASVNAQTQKFNGRLNLNINSLRFLSALSPDIQNITGQLDAEITASGFLAAPILVGKVDLQQGAISAPKLGIDFKPINASLTSADKKWRLNGSIYANKNALTIDGNGTFSPVATGTIHLQGTNFTVIDSNEYQVAISPALNLEFAPALLKLRGKIIIPTALIKPQTFTDSVSLSDDVVFVKEQSDDNPLPIDTDIEIEMGEKVMLAIKGLQGRLVGGVHLRQIPPGPLNATGELNVVDGKFQAYGQNLIIERGQLIFSSGALTNPGINVRAIRQFNNANNSFSGSNQLFDFKADNIQSLDFGSKTTVGIEVSGRVSNPKIKLFSTPSSLSQADILSLILLGKPASQASKSGAQLLMTAVSALNLNASAGSSQILSQLKDTLGLDFNFENMPDYNQKTNQTEDNTAFVVGKSLSRRLYISYNIGISQSDSSMFTLKYLLNKFFSIQVNAGMNSSGIDFLYTHQAD